MCWRRLLRNAYKGGILCESKSESERERECLQESGEKESCNGSSLAAIAAAASAAKELGVEFE